MTAEVRAARSGDVEAISDICTRAFRETYRGLLGDDYIERSIADFYRPERIAGEIAASPPRWLGYQVVEEDGRVLGAAGGGLTGPAAGELFVLYLEPAERGRGLGTLLLDRVIEQVRALGAEEIRTSVYDGNMKGIPFYEARGFEKTEKQQAYASEPADRAWSWRMRRPL